MYDEKNIPGSLAMATIAKNLSGFIGESPAMYVRMSFGSPGIKRARIWLFLLLEN